MDEFFFTIIAIVALGVFAGFIFSVVALVRASNALKITEQLRADLARRRFEEKFPESPKEAPPVTNVAPLAPPIAPPVERIEKPPAVPIPAAPPVIGAPIIAPAEVKKDSEKSGEPAPMPVPPVMPKVQPPAVPQAVAVPAMSPPETKNEDSEARALERFFGVNMLAWIGAFVAFLSVVFFLKYAFQHGWISEEVCAATGFVVSCGLIAGGLKLLRRYAVLGQSLVAGGVASLYAVTLACRMVYHFPFFTQPVMFAAMSAVTVAAFLLATRIDAQVVALIGLLGGFLTPPLLSTGENYPLGLFGYIALLDLGIVAAALRRKWNYLIVLAAAGTVFMQCGWAEAFLDTTQVPTCMAICTVFALLFSGTAILFRALKRESLSASSAGIAVPVTAFFFAIDLIYAAQPVNPILWFGFVLAIDVLLLAQDWRKDAAFPINALAGGFAFFAGILWTLEHLELQTLPAALGFYLIFGALHTAFPVLLQKFKNRDGALLPAQIFPSLALFSVLIGVLRFDEIPFSVWLAILFLDMIAIAVAALNNSARALAGALVMTLLTVGVCILKMDTTFAPDGSLPVIIAGFSVVFFGASFWIMKRGVAGTGEKPNAGMPAMAALMPFALLIMVVLRTDASEPLPVFGIGTVLILLTFLLTIFARADRLVLCALAGFGALEFFWQAGNLMPSNRGTALVWYAGIYVLFAVFPFGFRRRFSTMRGPWIAAAVAGIAQFAFVYSVAPRCFEIFAKGNYPGLLPALFALPALASFEIIRRTMPRENPARLSQLAWFGGTALFFVTLIFPIQFRHEWLTLGWALEGAALLWLFRRVPHGGLRVTGAVLLIAAFVRLALNSSVLEYHVRGDLPILNWYLYAYLVGAGALFAGAYFVRRGLDAGDAWKSASPVFNALGGVLLFLLLNIEIADFFTEPKASVLTFEFYGNFARDMSYTLGWSLFAIALLAFGIFRRNRYPRYAAIGLIGCALLKLFLHDLAHLSQLYLVGALAGVAIITLGASFAYRKFMPHDKV